MKTFASTFGLAAVLALALFTVAARAQDATAQNNSSASFQTFYDQLASQGTWIQTNNYGYVWQPTESNPNWRPYTYGHWINTPDGMDWVSDESFGWATYHYGRWVNIEGYGWVWVPGYTWAPAWVSWREDDDDVGWAPLPPDSDVGIDYYDDGDLDLGFGFHIGDDCDLAYGIGAFCYNFCPIAYIGDRDAWRHFRDPRDNFALINHTRNVTNINFNRNGAGRYGRVREEGPSVAGLNAHARTPIGYASLTSTSRPGGASLRGNSLAVYAPRINPSTVATARPTSVQRNLGNVTANRGTDINRPLAVNSRLSPVVATPSQVRAATLAERSVPSGARVATARTGISHPLTQPLTSMRADDRSAFSFGSRGRFSPVAPAGESRFTGERELPHSTLSSSGEANDSGAPVMRNSDVYSGADSRFTGADEGGSFRASSGFHSGDSVYHSEESPSLFHSGGSAFHSFGSSYHPQANFHSFSPPSSSHFGGGRSFSAHIGGGGGAHFSGGGHASGEGHASAGAGHR